MARLDEHYAEGDVLVSSSLAWTEVVLDEDRGPVRELIQDLGAAGGLVG